MDENKKIQEMVEEELRFITEEASATLNARMKPEFFSADASKKEIVLKYPVLEWEINGLGTLHGGMISAMLDFATSMSIKMFSDNCPIPPTISLTINFIRPVPANGDALVLSRVTSSGKKVGTAYGEVIIPSTGKIAATAVSTCSIPARM